jgi:hypothetical protein
VWFDAGEAERLIKAEGHHGIGGLFAALVRGMHIAGTSSPPREPD